MSNKNNNGGVFFSTPLSFSPSTTAYIWTSDDTSKKSEAFDFIVDNILSVNDAVLNIRHENRFVRLYCDKVIRNKKKRKDTGVDDEKRSA